MKVAAFLVTLTLLASTAAEAAYVRIWRGHQRPGLTDEAFLRGLNHALFPATGELAMTQARLHAYLPVVLPSELESVGLPSEVALLSYEDEEGYRAYRATPEGIHYGNMHWDLFDKEKSASLVPAPYAGRVAFEQAYEVVAQDPAWSAPVASFRVVLRPSGATDEAFLAQLMQRIEFVKEQSPFSYYVLVAKDYALEYLSTNVGVEVSNDVVITLPRGSLVTEGSGVRYTVGVDAAEAGVRDTWQRHIAAWKARDLDALLEDYNPSAVVIRNDEIYRGGSAIRTLFTELFARFDRVTVASIDRVIANGDVVYIHWRADGHLGTDTFVIEHGKIVTQTITADPEFWR